MPCPSIGPKLFWTGPICLGLVQIILERSKLYWTESKSKMFYRRVIFKQFYPVQNNFNLFQYNLDWFKIILDLKKDKALIY